MDIYIYVQSCGLAPNHDYCWLKIISSEDPLQEIPPLIKDELSTKAGKVKLTDLYESQAPSVVLARNGGQLLLLVSGLKAKQRSKDYGRVVRNSIAFVSEDEFILQRIAVDILEDWENFRKKIDDAVTFIDDKWGFQVEHKPINDYVDSVKEKVRADETRVKNINNKFCREFYRGSLAQEFVGSDQSWKQKLVDELRQSNLPKEEEWKGPLVVVTGNAADSILRKYVWRGISERIQPITQKETAKKNVTD